MRLALAIAILGLMYLPFFRPERAVEDFALESIETFPVWKVAFGCESKCCNEIFAVSSSAVLSLHGPLQRLVVELCVDNAAIESNILSNIQLVVIDTEVSRISNNTRRCLGELDIPGSILLTFLSM